MDKEIFYKIALQYLPNYGNVHIKKLLQYCGSGTEIFTNHEKVLKRLGSRNRLLALPRLTHEISNIVEKEMMFAERNGIKTCFITDSNYPERLRSCHDSPYFFYYKGDGNFNRTKVIAIVGTRNASNYGKDAVKKIISEIADKSISIISGLAMGIDTAAHEQALEYNLNTVAVMGSGFKYIYPESNYKLSKKILENGGTLISEYPFEMTPEKQNFPKRNRIIAGMADATIVMETAPKGGSIITAFIAHSYNRDVYAIPGSIFNKSQDGCHELIRNNMAALVDSGKNLIEMMGWDNNEKTGKQQDIFIELSEDEKCILNIIRKQREAGIDSIVSHTLNMSSSQIAGILLGLELKGIVECKPGKVYTTIY